MNHRDLETDFVIEIGKQTGEPSSQHCLAGTWRADEEQVMTSSSRHLQRQPRHRLTAHLGEIIDDERRLALVNGTHPTLDRRPPHSAGEHLHQLTERGHRTHLAARHRRRLTHTTRRHHPLEARINPDHRRDPGDRPHRPVEPQFASERPARQRLRLELLGGR